MPRITISSDEATPQPYAFDSERQLVTLGRGPDNDIILTGGGVSTSHAQMERVSGGFILRDLGSTNGLELNGVAMEVIDLTDGTEVAVGDVTFAFALSEDEMMSLADEPFTPHQRAAAVPEPAPAPADPTPLPQPEREYSPPHQAPPPPPPRSAYQQKKSGGPISTLVFLILTVAALIGGLAVRHYHETGRNLLEDVKAAHQPAAADTPAETE